MQLEMCTTFLSDLCKAVLCVCILVKRRSLQVGDSMTVVRECVGIGVEIVVVYVWCTTWGWRVGHSLVWDFIVGQIEMVVQHFWGDLHGQGLCCSICTRGVSLVVLPTKPPP